MFENNINRIFLDICFLVFEKHMHTNKKNIILKKNNISWLKKLYLQKSLRYYGNNNLFKTFIIDNDNYELVIYDIHKKINLDEKINEILNSFDLTNNNDSCKSLIYNYSNVIFQLTKNNKHKLESKNIECKNRDDSITWSQRGKDETYYPNLNLEQINININKWKEYFNNGNVNIWNNLPAKYHFIWRNKLIAAHEIIHKFNSFSMKYFNITKSNINTSRKYRVCNLVNYNNNEVLNSNILDNEKEIFYCDEWIASASNMIVFLKYLENQYNLEEDIHKKINLQLEAIGSLNYLVTLLKLIRTIINNTNNITFKKRIDILDSWGKLNNKTKEEFDFVYNSITKASPGYNGFSWANTYSKHMVALMY